MTADNEILDSVSPEQLVGLFRELGYPAERRSTVNLPIIDSSLGGVPFSVFLIAAQGEPGYSVASLAVFFEDIHLPLSFVNSWNRRRYFAKAIVNDNGSMVLEMNLVLHGVAKAYLRRSLAIWHNAINLFLEEYSELEERSAA